MGDVDKQHILISPLLVETTLVIVHMASAPGMRTTESTSLVGWLIDSVARGQEES